MSEINVPEIIRMIEQRKGPVVAFSRMLNTPADDHLAMVVVNIRDGEYAVWHVNLEVSLDYSDCGCYNGQYFTTDQRAIVNRTMALSWFATRLCDQCAAL